MPHNYADPAQDPNIEAAIERAEAEEDYWNALGEDECWLAKYEDHLYPNESRFHPNL